MKNGLFSALLLVLVSLPVSAYVITYDTANVAPKSQVNRWVEGDFQSRSSFVPNDHGRSFVLFTGEDAALVPESFDAALYREFAPELPPIENPYFVVTRLDNEIFSAISLDISATSFCGHTSATDPGDCAIWINAGSSKAGEPAEAFPGGFAITGFVDNEITANIFLPLEWEDGPRLGSGSGFGVFSQEGFGLGNAFMGVDALRVEYNRPVISTFDRVSVDNIRTDISSPARIPEPSTLVLLCVGLLGLVLRRRT